MPKLLHIRYNYFYKTYFAISLYVYISIIESILLRRKHVCSQNAINIWEKISTLQITVTSYFIP